MTSRVNSLWLTVATSLAVLSLGTLSLLPGPGNDTRVSMSGRTDTSSATSDSSSLLTPIPDPISSPGAPGCGKGDDEPCGRMKNGDVIIQCAEGDQYKPCPGGCYDDDGKVTQTFCNDSASPCKDCAAKCPVCEVKNTMGTMPPPPKACQSCDPDDPYQLSEEPHPQTCTRPESVTTNTDLIPIGEYAVFNGNGEGVACFAWSGGDESVRPMGAPEGGPIKGSNYVTKWTSSGQKTVTATGANGWNAEKQVTVVEVTKVVNNAHPDDEGPLMLCVDEHVDLRAIPSPGGTFPMGHPKWSLTSKPDGSKLTNPESPYLGETMAFTPDRPGAYTLTATCGSSSASFEMIAKICEPDLDIDSNNDGVIASTNLESEDVYEAQTPGCVLPIGYVVDARIEAPFDEGVLTLTSTFGAASAYGSNTQFGEFLSVGINTTTWDLGNDETPPDSFPIYVSAVDPGAPYLPLNIDEPSRSGSLMLTWTAPNGTVKTDTVALTIVRPVSRSPQNNNAKILQPFFYGNSSAQELGKSTLEENGYAVTVSNSKELISPYWGPGNYEIPYSELAQAANSGVLILESHGGSSASLAIYWARTKEKILEYVGVNSEANLPSGLSIHERREQDVKGLRVEGYLLAANADWVSGNWSGGAGARSIVILLTCHSHLLFDSINAAEVFGYTWCCTKSDHIHDIQLLLGRMADNSLRPAGIAFAAGGYTSRSQCCSLTPECYRCQFPDPPEGSCIGCNTCSGCSDSECQQSGNLPVLKFARKDGGTYWSTLVPGLFAVADASGLSADGNKAGYAGVHLDTEKDNAISLNEIIFQSGGSGTLSSGPYNVQPSWGAGCQYILSPSQNLQLHLDNTKVVGDGSTQKLWLEAPVDWNVSN